MVSTKRKRDQVEQETSTPRKLRAQRVHDDGIEDEENNEAAAPSRWGATQHIADTATPRSILKKSGPMSGLHRTTPKSSRKLLFDLETPNSSDQRDPHVDTPILGNADRSARRKSKRRLIGRSISGEESDDEALDEEDILAQQILSDEDGEEGLHDPDTGDEVDVPEPATPSKRGRGRPKVSPKGKKLGRQRKVRSPTPPQDLPPHEQYFWQNRTGGTKTSNNTFSSHSLLNHDEFFQTMQPYEEGHESERKFLLQLHSRAYDQWIFELEEGFNICLYGYGSKRPIIQSFTAHLYQHLLDLPSYQQSGNLPALIIVNGYSSGTTIKEILLTVASLVDSNDTRLPNHPASLLTYLLHNLAAHPPDHPITVIINSIDSPALRKNPAPSMLGALAAHPSIHLVCTADTPNFSLLWDVGLKAQYKFLFHDATTFAPYEAEIDVVESVNELLGRSSRQVGGRDGIGFVLRSLPENARSLFRIIATEQLAVMLESVESDRDDAVATSRGKRAMLPHSSIANAAQGVEYRVLYHKAVEEFVCSSELGFRTLLKEFHDHQMIESRKDAMGTERLWVPFRQEELEGLVDDLSGG